MYNKLKLNESMYRFLCNNGMKILNTISVWFSSLSFYIRREVYDTKYICISITM